MGQPEVSLSTLCYVKLCEGRLVADSPGEVLVVIDDASYPSKTSGEDITAINFHRSNHDLSDK
eukprot:scaffold4140_cov178-Ochromonas_danica.AAC.12